MIRIRERLYLEVYLAGYGGWNMPRSLRRILARTEMHRAWLAGFTGRFEEAGVRYGPANPYGKRLLEEFEDGPSKGN